MKVWEIRICFKVSAVTFRLELKKIKSKCELAKVAPRRLQRGTTFKCKYPENGRFRYSDFGVLHL